MRLLGAVVVDDAIHLVKTARTVGIEARVMGSVGVLIHSGVDPGLRPAPIKDIDIVVYPAARERLQGFLQSSPMCWSLARQLLLLIEDRETYWSVGCEYSLDVFYGFIDGNHPIALDGRLELSFPALDWTDLLLSKLQRVHLRPQDVWDCCTLLRMGTSRLDVDRLASLVGSSWGLYTTVHDNLGRLDAECPDAIEAIRHICHTAEHAPKGVAWILRSIIGRRVKWWRDIYNVASPSRVGGA